MNTILVTDIFGKTPAVIKLNEVLSVGIKSNPIVDPYNGIHMGFKNEAEAYAYFVENVGLEAYQETLLKVIQSNPSARVLVGFSIGASIIWNLSEQQSIAHITRGICYYGSQIRQTPSITPLFDIEFIYPKKEAHFDVVMLASKLAKKENVKARQVANLHGFMNPCSVNYHNAAYVEELDWLQSSIKLSV